MVVDHQENLVIMSDICPGIFFFSKNELPLISFIGEILHFFGKHFH